MRLLPPHPLAAAAGLIIVVCAANAAAHDGGKPHQHGVQPPTSPTPPAPSTTDGGDTLAPVQPDPNGQAQPGAAPTTEPAQPSLAPPPEEGFSSPGSRQRTIMDTNWRQRNRRDSGQDWFEAGHFTFELRFAPYAWQAGESPSGGADFAKFFGDSPSTFYFGLELDWLPLHIPYVASIGPGFGWGWSSVSGNAVTDSGVATEAETSVTIFPMHASGVIRIDGPMRKFGFPLVPHAKVGFGFTPWDSSTDGQSETSSGTSAGIHLGLGASLALNTFDPSAGRAMYEDTGIRHAYLWVEWMYDDMGGIGKAEQLYVGTSTAALGLALDW